MLFRSMKVLGLLMALSLALLMFHADVGAQNVESSEQPAAEVKKEEPIAETKPIKAKFAA